MISEKQKSLLISSNIGVDFHNKKLSTYDHPKAQEVQEWINNNMAHDMSVGRNLCIVGSNHHAYNITNLAARGYILKSTKPAWLYSLDELCNSEDIQELYQEYYFIVLTNINPRERDTNPEMFKRFESLLFRYIDRNYKIILHFPVDDLDSLPEDTLLSKALIGRIKEKYKIVKVD